MGFISRCLRDHTIGHLNLGLIEGLPRDKFEIVLFRLSGPDDPIAQRYAAAADHVIPLAEDLQRRLHEAGVEIERRTKRLMDQDAPSVAKPPDQEVVQAERVDLVQVAHATVGDHADGAETGRNGGHDLAEVGAAGRRAADVLNDDHGRLGRR